MNFESETTKRGGSSTAGIEMKQLIIVPIVDVHLFRGLEEVCRDHDLVALVGESEYERSRHGYASEELFLEAVARGDADRYTFQSLEEAATFAKEKLERLNQLGKAIEEGAAGRKDRSRHSQKSEPRSFETLRIDALFKKG
ncbi:MAG TPA: hypothetical protein VMA71_02580 [Alloacidobacterium sp.]|jgi:hypothetical protein|nr:hypothetical protein [Alloacidobacterium sp.]